MFDDELQEDEPDVCLECGEEATETHPEFPADRLCVDCLIVFWETEVEQAQQELDRVKNLKAEQNA